MKWRRLALLLIGFTLFSSSGAVAAFKKAVHVKAEMISDVKSIQAGQPFWMGVRYVMDDHWHIYWKNPGGSGTPTEIKWNLPAGFKADELQWPYPGRHSMEGLAYYGYEKEVVLLAKITPPASLPSGKVELKAQTEWLECADVCIPGSADVSISLPVSAAPQTDDRWTEKIAALKSQWPLETSAWAVTAAATPSGYKITVAAPEGSSDELYDLTFFPDEGGLIDDSAPQKFSKSGKTFSLELTKSDVTQETSPTAIKGVLVTSSGWRGPGSEKALAINASIGADAAPSDARAILLAILFSFIGGLILNLMPCVLPVLSIKILGFVNQAAGDKKEIFKQGVIFALGVMVSFWTLAGLLLFLRAGGQQLGWGFQLQSPVFVAALATLFLMIGLNLMGLFEVGTGLIRLGGVTTGKSGSANSFLSGVLATIVATPCTAPFMGSALGFALTQPAYVSILIFSSLGLGMALPYLLLSANPSLLKFVPKPGMWMDTFKQTMGFFMLATVLWLTWVYGHQSNIDALTVLLFCLLGQAMGVWLLTRGGKISKVIGVLLIASSLLGQFRGAFSARPSEGGAEASKNGIAWEKYSKEDVEAKRKEGRVVFVDFTASWCLTCQVNERVVFGSPDVLAKFKDLNIATFKADWTSRDPKITEALQSFGRSGVPMYLLYAPGSDQPQILPEILTPQIVLAALNKTERAQ